MNTIKISRANFPGVGNFSWVNYFTHILSKKYKVVIDDKKPDLVFYSNLHWNAGETDHWTNTENRGISSYDQIDCKKIFISGEARPGYIDHLNRGNYALGYEHITHDRYLRFPTYVLDAYVLWNEAGMFTQEPGGDNFPDAFKWLDRNVRQYNRTLKTNFCSVVQASDQKQRGQIFDLIEKHYPVKSSGPWRGKPGMSLNLHQYHNPKYIGSIDGFVYQDKIAFFEDAWFNIAFQWTNTPYLTQEKLIHAFAADTIPVFWGNENILEEGFNPEAFINCHDYDSFEHVVEKMLEIYHNIGELNAMIFKPVFVDNKLPDYFSEEYMLEFLERVIND